MTSNPTTKQYRVLSATAHRRILLVILDLDRTLFDTSQYYADVLEWVRTKPYGDTVASTAVEAEKYGDFDIFRFLEEIYAWNKETVRDQVAAYISDKYANQPDHSYLLPGAKELMEYLDQHRGVFVGIITTGSRFHQEFKLGLCPEFYNIPREIIDGSKGERIQADLTAKKAVHFQNIWFPRFALVDDKASNVLAIKPVGLLSGDPSQHLFHVIRKDSKDNTPTGSLGINTVPSLFEVTAYFRNLLASKP